MTMAQSCTMENMILVPMVSQLSVLVNLQILDKGEAYPQQIGGTYRELIVSITTSECMKKLFILSNYTILRTPMNINT
jgi:hypothetical protein